MEKVILKQDSLKKRMVFLFHTVFWFDDGNCVKIKRKMWREWWFDFTCDNLPELRVNTHPKLTFLTACITHIFFGVYCKHFLTDFDVNTHFRKKKLYPIPRIHIWGHLSNNFGKTIVILYVTIYPNWKWQLTRHWLFLHFGVYQTYFLADFDVH